jgi:hypothetical protein
MYPSASSQQWLALSAGDGESKMAHFLTGDEKDPELIYDDDYRSYLMARSHSSDGYRFGRTQGKHVLVHARTALSRVNGFLKNTIEAIATAKLRRMERELELRGVRYDRPDDSRTARTPEPTAR